MRDVSDISDRVSSKLKKIVTDEAELKMIVELLKTEQRYEHGENTSKQVIRKEFQLLLDQYFPLPQEDKNE